MKNFKDLPSRELNGGVQHIFKSENGFGASIVQHSFSYGKDNGKWELAVIKFNSEDDYDFTIRYDTVITDDVLGYLSEQDVMDVLLKIDNLKIETA